MLVSIALQLAPLLLGLLGITTALFVGRASNR